MGLFDGLRSLFSGGPGGDDPNAYWIYVQCGKCGEALRVRVDRRWDLAQVFANDDRVAGYMVTKDIVGSQRCFQPIQVHQEFDKGYKLKKQEITNGKFLTRQEYEALQASTEQAAN